jgi:hypothetical protein
VSPALVGAFRSVLTATDIDGSYKVGAARDLGSVFDCDFCPFFLDCTMLFFSRHISTFSMSLFPAPWGDTNLYCGGNGRGGEQSRVMGGRSRGTPLLVQEGRLCVDYADRTSRPPRQLTSARSEDVRGRRPSRPLGVVHPQGLCRPTA